MGQQLADLCGERGFNIGGHISAYMLLISYALEVFGDAGKVREGVRAFAVKLNQMDIPVAARVGPASVDDESHMDRIGNLTVITEIVTTARRWTRTCAYLQLKCERPPARIVLSPICK